MDRKKRNIIILVILVLILVLTLTFVLIDLFSQKNFNNLLILDKKEDEEIINKVDDNDDSFVVDNSDKDNNKNNYVDDNKNKENNKNDNSVNNQNDNKEELNKDEDKTSNNESNVSYSENDVVSYFENIERDVDRSGSFKEKFKEYFITTIDFIFYDKEIKGYTFSELSNITKIKIISVALKIDSKIEEYFPNYKENISNTSSRIYSNAKERLVTLYLDISSDICAGDNKKECDKVKEIFGEVKDVCKIGWEFIKTLVSGGVTRLREWYEIYSGK